MNETQKHTPGPWVVEYDGVSIAIGGVICLSHPGPDGAPLGVIHANARLIASAPDMREAIMVALPYVAAYAALHPGSGEDIDAAADMMRAAIARADGVRP